tara:strand:+ start:968 stop:4621 length:3654 start_codon:yes stop_codon:yes gene_type:complete
MTIYNRRAQEYYDNLERLNIEKENIFYRQNEKNSLVSKNFDKDETLKLYTDYKNKFRPKIIPKDPSTFCFFGSAKSRYENSIYNILNYYPFDGTQQETINWLSSSSTLDIALVQKHWPSSVGHINFTNGELINFFAGPQKIAGSEYTGKLQRGESALRLDPSKGNTVEFWLKKGSWLSSGAGQSEHIFTIGTHPLHVTATADQFQFNIRLARQDANEAGNTGSPFFITYKSGSVGFDATNIGGTALTYATHGRNHDAYIDDKWHHYTFKVYQAPRENHPTQQTIYAEMFMDGKKIDTQRHNVLPDPDFMGSKDSYMAGCIGNLLNKTEGKLLGSIDDFRFWKGKRTNREISRYYDKKIYASTVDLEGEADEYKSRLGVYYKFNKKKANILEPDSIVLDYSGNEMLGKIGKYNAGTTRVDTSAINLSEISKNTEIPDLNLLASDPSIISLKDDLIKISNSYDKNNHNSILKMIPNWANDPYGSSALNEKSDFYILLNMIAEEFDEIKLNIDSIRMITNRNFDTNYVSLGESGKEISGIENPGKIDFIECQDAQTELDIYPGNRIDFPERNLEKLGFKIIAKPLELNTNPEDDFESIIGDLRLSMDPTTTKRLILDNVLIAATSIIKKKGTERALEEMLSCWGIGKDLISLNVYGQNSEIDLDKSFKNSTLKKIKSFDFSLTPNTTFFMSAPAIPSPEDDSKSQESLRYIPGSSTGVKESNITFQGNFIFPPAPTDLNYGLETSVFGIREIDTTQTSLTPVVEASNKAWLQVNTVKLDASSASAKFVLRSPIFGSDTLESPFVNDIYDNTRWNLNLRVHRVGDEESRFLSASSSPQNNSWEIAFSGYNYTLDSLQNSFSVSRTITQDQYENFIRSNRHVFIGAERENIKGSTVVRKSNFKFINFKLWNSSLSDDEIQNLSQNVSYWGRSLSTMFNSGIRDNTPKNKDLIFKINMSEHNSVPTTGVLNIRDFTSGSMNDIKSTYGKTLGAKYPFSSTIIDSSVREEVLKTEFITVMGAQEPELISTNEEVKIKKTELEKFDINTKDESRILSFEKSLYKQISKEMIDFLSGIESLNNLIGEPVNKYRQDYKLMNHFRQVFFKNVESDSQFERFVEYYRWIDFSLGNMLEQIVPASAQVNAKLQNVIESHILERNKYHHKMPILKSYQREFEVQMRNSSNGESWTPTDEERRIMCERFNMPGTCEDADDSNEEGRRGWWNS